MSRRNKRRRIILEDSDDDDDDDDDGADNHGGGYTGGHAKVEGGEDERDSDGEKEEIQQIRALLNRQNDLHRCHKCGEEIAEDWELVSCELCEKDFHSQCLDVDIDELDDLFRCEQCNDEGKGGRRNAPGSDGSAPVELRPYANDECDDDDYDKGDDDEDLYSEGYLDDASIRYNDKMGDSDEDSIVWDRYTHTNSKSVMLEFNGFIRTSDIRKALDRGLKHNKALRFWLFTGFPRWWHSWKPRILGAKHGFTKAMMQLMRLRRAGLECELPRILRKILDTYTQDTETGDAKVVEVCMSSCSQRWEEFIKATKECRAEQALALANEGLQERREEIERKQDRDVEDNGDSKGPSPGDEDEKGDRDDLGATKPKIAGASNASTSQTGFLGHLYNMIKRLYTHWFASIILGRSETVQSLIKAGFPINVKLKDSRNKGAVYEVYDLLWGPPEEKQRNWEETEAVAEMFSAANQYGRNMEHMDFLRRSTGLRLASMKGQIHVAEVLLEANADIEEKDEWSLETPLFKAAYAGQKDMVEFLLKCHANPNVCTNLGTAYAQASLLFELTTRMGERDISNIPYNNYYSIVTSLVQAGADIEEARNGTSTLQYMCGLSDGGRLVRCVMRGYEQRLKSIQSVVKQWCREPADIIISYLDVNLKALLERARAESDFAVVEDIGEVDSVNSMDDEEEQVDVSDDAEQEPDDAYCDTSENHDGENSRSASMEEEEEGGNGDEIEDWEEEEDYM